MAAPLNQGQKEVREVSNIRISKSLNSLGRTIDGLEDLVMEIESGQYQPPGVKTEGDIKDVPSLREVLNSAQERIDQCGKRVQALTEKLHQLLF